MPDSWTTVRLGEVTHIVMGQAPPGDMVSEDEEGLPFLQGNAEFGDIHPSAQFVCRCAPRQCEPGDMLVSVRAPVGALNLADRTYGIGRGLAAVRFSGMNATYGRHALHREVAQLSKVAQGSTFEAVSRRELSDIKINVPSSKDEQRRIAEILDTIDSQISAHRRIVVKSTLILEALAQNYMSQAEKYSMVSLAFLVRSAVDGPFGSNLKSEHYVQAPGVRLVRLQNIGVGKFLDSDRAYISSHHASFLRKHDVRGGDLIVASLGDERHPMARACLYPEDFAPGIVKADCFRIRLKPQLALHSFVMRIMNSRLIKASVNAASQGVTRDRVNLTSLLSIKIPLPPVSYQRHLSEVLDVQEAAIRENECELSKLQLLKQGLMDDLPTGRVRVTNVANEGG
jgi:type I restriction enzyme, S subunit